MSAAAGTPGRTLTAVPGVSVGHAHDRDARTGCTAVLGPFRGAVEVRGLATGSRELDALSPLHVVPRCDALLLTGGSAFGLSAADGVVDWLEDRGRGFVTSAARVPIVPAAVIYDLSVGDASVRPGPGMGAAAAEAAHDGPVEEGAVGVGCGATVGKLRGGTSGAPSGVGSWADGDGGPAVAALAVVNAFGDVLDGRGRIVAGARGDDGGWLDTDAALRRGFRPEGFGEEGAVENTTLGVVATDAPLPRDDLRVMARQAMNGLLRRVRPAATPFDGDLVVALSTGGGVGEEDAAPPAPAERGELLRLSLRAAHALERAVERAATRAGADGGGASRGGAGRPDAGTEAP